WPSALVSCLDQRYQAAVVHEESTHLAEILRQPPGPGDDRADILPFENHRRPVWLTIWPFSGGRERERSDRRARPTATAGWAAGPGRPPPPNTQKLSGAGLAET